MKKFMTNLVLLLFLSSLSRINAQEENYDAVYLSLKKEYTLNPDGTVDFRYSKALKLQNYRSINRLYGETFVVYNPDYQDLVIEQAYTIMADGKKVITPSNAFNEVLPHFAAHAPAFNKLREMVITHTGLEIGATIFIDYRIHSDKNFAPAFMGSSMLAEEQPVKSMTVVIRVPESQPVFFHLFNASLKPTETSENGFRVYTWTTNDIPAMETEKLQPHPAYMYPSLIFSTAGNYQALVDFFTNQEAFRYQTDPVMDGFVAGPESENQKKAEQAFTIQESVVKEINLFEVPEELTGYRLRTPVEVWNSNGGTVAEKALLMSALLKKAGIPANPALLFPASQFDANIGNLSTIEEWAVRTEIPSRGIVFLSVKQVNAYDMQTQEPGGVFMVLNEDKTIQLVTPEKDQAGLSMKGVFVIDTAMNLSGDLSGILSGPAIPFLALSRNEDKLKHYLRGTIESAKLSAISFSGLAGGEASFTCTLSKPGALKKDSDMYYFGIPCFSTGINNWDIGQLTAQRPIPVQLPSPVKESYNITISLPEEMKLFSGPQEIRIDNKAGSFLFLVKANGNVIQIQKELVIDNRDIETRDYPVLKELLDYWSLWQTNNLIFRR